MNPLRLHSIEELFHSALALEPSRRGTFLDGMCAGDELLRREVEDLLDSHGRAERFLAEPPSELAAAMLAGDGPSAHAAGRTVGHYQLVEPLAAGGMGEVFIAVDTRSGRKAALKLLHPHFIHDPERIQRFRQEARVVVALNHPNILTVYEVGEDDATYFIAGELVEGETVRQRLAYAPMGLFESLDVAIQVAGALAAAHEAGIVHRDVKPENVMLRPDGYVKVLDFSIAKLTESRAPAADESAAAASTIRTEPGLLVGTPHYMSPEQSRGVEVDGRSDIWSLGAVLYEMVAGRRPFEGETTSDIIASILKTEPTPLMTLAPGVPAELWRIVSRALRKDRERRYQTAGEFALDLKNLRREAEYAAEIPPGPQPETANRAAGAQGGHLAGGNSVVRAVPRTDEIIARLTSWRPVSRVKAGAAFTALFITLGGLALTRIWSGGMPAAEGGLKAGVETTARPALVSLPGGTFQMGLDDVPLQIKQYSGSFALLLYSQWPAHPVTVKAFGIDRTEVTNVEYAQFVKEAGHAPPVGWEGDNPKAGEESLPVTGVSFDDADAFAVWRSERDGITYRLPTEEEWEYAARGGGDLRLYPWGDRWVNGRANVESDAPRPVGSFTDGRTPQGVEDMIGNVWEWTCTKAMMYPGNDMTLVPPQDRDKIITRGGSYESRAYGELMVTAATRRWIDRATRNPVLGFRLVHPLEPQ